MAGMGVGELAALALAAGGTVASYSAAQDQQDAQRNTLNRQLENTEKATDKSVDLIQTEANQYSPEARAAAMTAAENEAATRSQQDLEGAGGATVATAGDAGNVSKDFLTAKADRAVSEGSRLTALSRELAKIRAPGQVLQKEGYSQGNLASALQNIQGSNANMASANSADAQSIQAPAYGQLGSIATALGGAYLGSKARTGTGSQIAWNTNGGWTGRSLMATSRISTSLLAGALPGIRRGAQSLGSGGMAYDQGFDQAATLQSKLAQALATTRAYNAKADQDTAETGILTARPGLAEEQAAMQAGVTVPQVRAARAFTRTGNPSALEVPDLSNLDAGPPPSVALSPAQQGKIAGALRQMLPVLTNVKDNKADDLANAARIYQQVDGAQAVIDGKAPATNFGRAMAAAAGKPLFNAGATGAVLDNFAGTLDTANPMAGAAIALRGAQAGAQNANAAQSYASAGASNALADQRRAVTAAGKGGPGGKIPIGYRWSSGEDGEARLEPIPGGPKDPNAQTGKPLPAERREGLPRKPDQPASRGEGARPGDRQGLRRCERRCVGHWRERLPPDALLNRLDPKGVDTRAAISDLGSLVLHDRSGAAVTAAEFPRLAPFIPTATDDQPTSAKKLRQFVQNYRAVMDDAEEFYKASGYNVPKITSRGTPPATEPAAAPPADAGGWSIQKVN